MLTMYLGRHNKTFHAKDLREASAIYCRERDKSGLGASRWPEREVYDDSLPTGEDIVARISYNGRVWAPGEWKPGVEPIMEAQPYDGQEELMRKRVEDFVQSQKGRR